MSVLIKGIDMPPNCYACPFNELVSDICDQVECPLVEVVHGEWLDGSYTQPCSVCKYKGRKSWHYCPNCGADMRKGENNDQRKDT